MLDHRPMMRTTIGFVVLMFACNQVNAQSGTRTPAAGERVQSNHAHVGTWTGDSANGVALVELFTSQGCSSCPAADAVLRQVDLVAKQGKHPVYVLSFHVDYWNRLGWTDPYSNPAYSRQQRAYASAAGSKRVYTPQMIVNGTHEFVGSKKDKANAAIHAALKQGSLAKVRLGQALVDEGKEVSLPYQVDGDTDGHLLNVAIVQSPNANQVSRGENSGRKLSHVNVVRAFKTIVLRGKSGGLQLAIPADVDVSQAKVVAYIQNRRTLQIVGAATGELKPR